MLCFLVLSKPVLVRDGVFGVLQGTADGIELKKFATMSEARSYHESIVTSFNMAIELPLQLIRVDDESSFPVLRSAFEEVYQRRIREHGRLAFALGAVCSFFLRYMGKVSRLLH